MTRTRRQILGRSRNRFGVAFLAAVAVATVMAAGWLFMQLLETEANMDSIVREDAMWAIFQTDRHMHELHHLAELAAVTGTRGEHEAMRTSYDILYSRVSLLERGSFLLDLSGEGRIQTMAHELSAFVMGLAPTVDGLDPAQPDYQTAMTEFEQSLEPWVRASNEMLLAANAALNQMRVEDRGQRAVIQDRLALLAVVLIFAFLGIVALMMLQLRKISRSNQLMAILQERARRKALRAQAASKAKSAFLATMSHEIRTPLNGIIGSAELLSLGDLPAAQTTQLDTIRASADLLRDLIDGILDFSRLDAGAMEQHSADTDLSQMGRVLKRAFADQAGRAGLSLSIDLPSQRVRVNDTRLRQVLINLIGNALKFTHEGGVRVRGMLLENGRLHVEVEDDGIGIAAADLPKLFAEFSQIDGSHRRRYGGSGLGLAISRRIVEGLGGEIHVNSTLGRGSLFWFDIPVEPLGAAPRVEDVETPVAVAPAAMPLDILVVEDNDINLSVIRFMLEHLGHRVTDARDGLEAVQILADLRPDVVLMDMQMPNMDGLEATRLLRERGQSLPIIGVTANAFDQDRRACIAAGMNDFLPKPVTIEGLARVLREVLPEVASGAPIGQHGLTQVAVPVTSAELEEIEIENEQLRDLAEALGPEMLAQLIDRFALEIDGLEVALTATLSARDAAAQDSVLHSFKGAALTLGMEGSGSFAQRLRAALPIGPDDVAGLLATAKRDVLQARAMLATLS